MKKNLRKYRTQKSISTNKIHKNNTYTNTVQPIGRNPNYQRHNIDFNHLKSYRNTWKLNPTPEYNVANYQSHQQTNSSEHNIQLQYKLIHLYLRKNATNRHEFQICATKRNTYSNTYFKRPLPWNRDLIQ